MGIVKHGACPLALALLLTACGGGGSGDADGGNGSGSGGPVVPAWSERIEPFEPKAAPAPTPASQPRRDAAIDPARMPLIALGPLPSHLLKAAAASGAAGAPRQIGHARALAATAGASATAALLQWQPTDHGTQVAALRFASEGARGLRLGVRVHSLPPGTVLRFAAAHGALVVDDRELQAIAERNARAGASDEVTHTYWGPDSGTDEATLEIEIPAAAASAAVRLAVPRLAHFVMTAADAEHAVTLKAAAAGCQVDLSCQPEYLDQGRSVARMTFVAEDGNAYYCTGTLLNDRASSGTPYFLSASHCIPSQVVASTLETDWFYRSARCGSAQAAAGVRRVRGGATLLYAAAGSDTAFMRLNASMPAGVIYAGSYYGSLPLGQPLAGVHHADGGLQRLSLGALLGYGSCSQSGCSEADDGGDYLRLRWYQGMTEPGSSGSGAFVTIGARRYLVGPLHGGNASCDNPSGVDFYGRFERSYHQALKRWLSP